MIISEKHQFTLENNDNLNFRFEKSPNFKANLNHEYLMIHYTAGPSVQSVVNAFKSGVLSAHLVIGRDGLEVVQMVDFDKKGVHAHTYNNNAIGIELDYTGDLRDVKNHWKSIERFKSTEYLYGQAENDWRLRPWPLYPQAQLDMLLRVSRVIMERYKITKILGHEEINEGKLDPGPAFPMGIFKEKLLGGETGRLALEETIQTSQLRTGPGTEYPLLPQISLPKGTSVSITGEEKGWVLVEVMEELDGNTWTKGWVEANVVQAKRFLPVVHNNRLFTQDGRKYKSMTPFFTNFSQKKGDLKNPKYIIMHITTGIKMQSTINWFRNPNAGVSAHLLIGRDGRVLQFVDFDTIAYHAGLSFWEGDSNLNSLSIGIELDNGGPLRQFKGEYKLRKDVIPESEVERAQHWKESTEKGWHKFTQVQLDVVMDILKALKERFPSIKEILAHDVVNLKNRLDPGPLFPMEDFREELFKRRKPEIKEHEIVFDADVYDIGDGSVPDINHPKHNGGLPALSGIKILEEAGDWSLIKVLTATPGRFRGLVGWVLSNTIQHNKKIDKTTVGQEFYRKLTGRRASQTPPMKLKINPLPAGTRVRVQYSQPGWKLIASLGEVKGTRWMEGWVRSEAVKEVNEPS